VTLAAAFDDFLTSKVNLSDAQLIRLNDRVDAVTGYLREKSHFAAYIDDFVPQGSLAQKTIIRPLNKPVFDADVLMRVNAIPGWSAKDYVEELKQAFLNSSTYQGMAHRRTRCVYVDYADEFHIDVVPHVIANSSVTNRQLNAYELSLPENFNRWLDGKDRIASGNLPEVIRLLKWLRDKRGNATKSLFLSVLVGHRIDAWKTSLDSGYYADVPTAFAHVVADLATYLQGQVSLPAIYDPAQTGCDLADRWTPEGYTALRNWVTLTLAPKVAAAFAADLSLAEPLWQDVFGTDFKLTSTALGTKAAGSLAPRTEQWLDRTFGIPMRLSEKVELVGRVRQHGVVNKAYDLPSRGNRVGKGREIDFEVRSSTVSGPFDLYWKVRNYGAEASDLDALRGGSSGPLAEC